MRVVGRMRANQTLADFTRQQPLGRKSECCGRGIIYA